MVAGTSSSEGYYRKKKLKDGIITTSVSWNDASIFDVDGAEFASILRILSSGLAVSSSTMQRLSCLYPARFPQVREGGGQYAWWCWLFRSVCQFCVWWRHCCPRRSSAGPLSGRVPSRMRLCVRWVP